MKTFLTLRFAIATLLLWPSVFMAVRADSGAAPYSIAITRSEMKRCPAGVGLDYVYGKKWQYSVHTELEAMLNAADSNPDLAAADITDYVIDYIDQLIDSNGGIYNYRITDYNLDNVKGGTLLLYAYKLTGKKKYLTAANTLWNQLKNQPVTSDGGYWHKYIYPYQMWLDGLFMAEPFAAQYAAQFLTGQELDEAFAHIVKQFRLVTIHTYDPVTGLYRHGWDEKRAQKWADKTTGQSAHAWGRAMGWTFMAIPYVLEEMPADHPDRGELEEIFRTMAAAVMSAQDADSGLWWQVLDCPGRKGNYLEATASAMFVYAMLRGARMGVLDDTCRQAAIRGWDALNDRLVVEGKDGSISLTQCCSVGGLGGSSNRDGSFEYYISEAVRDNDGKGMGPFINAAVEMELLEREPASSVSLPGIESGDTVTAVYDLQGRRLPSVVLNSLPPGTYIVIYSSSPARKIIVR